MRHPVEPFFVHGNLAQEVQVGLLVRLLEASSRPHAHSPLTLRCGVLVVDTVLAARLYLAVTDPLARRAFRSVGTRERVSVGVASEFERLWGGRRVDNGGLKACAE